MTLFAAAVVLGAQAGPVTIAPPKIAMGVRPIAMAPAATGSRVALALEDGSVRIVDAATRATVRNLAKHPQPAYAIAWSADGAWIATGDESARLWIEDARNGAKVREYRNHTRGIQKVSFNSPRTRMVTTGKDDFIKVYDVSDPKPKEKVSIAGAGANFYGATFSPTLATTIATGILGPGGRLYDANSGKVQGFLTDGQGQGVFDVAYAPAGNRAATAGRDGNVIVWNPTNSQKIGTLRGHKDFVMYVAFSPNGKLIASGSTDATVKVWNAVTLQKVADIPGQSYVGSPVAFTGDGKYLLTVDDDGFLDVHAITPAQAGTPVQVVVPGVKKPVPAKKPVKKPVRRRGG